MNFGRIMKHSFSIRLMGLLHVRPSPHQLNVASGSKSCSLKQFPFTGKTVPSDFLAGVSIPTGREIAENLGNSQHKAVTRTIVEFLVRCAELI